MTNYAGNAAMKERLQDLLNGLHMAMTEIINNKNYQQGELILRQMDGHLCETIDRMKTFR
jgi:hypothetical protein